MGVNRVVYGGRTLIDITESTVSPETLSKGVTAYNAAGELIEGTVVMPNCFLKTDTGRISLGNMTLVEKNTDLIFETDTLSFEIGEIGFEEQNTNLKFKTDTATYDLGSLEFTT